MSITDQTFVEKFVKIHYDNFDEQVKADWGTCLTDELMEDEDFKNWFNEDWVADRWINAVSDVVDDLSVKEKMDMLNEYGLDDALDMLRMIGIESEEYSLDKLTWHIIDRWYSYSYVIRKFKEGAY